MAIELQNPNATATPPHRFFRHAGIALLALAILLVLAEAGLRKWGLTSLVLYHAHSTAGYLLQPNQHVRFGGIPIDINGWGLRDPRPLAKKEAGVRRIIVLGDSVTWGGVQIRQEELFTSRLESLLPDIEVVNAGVNGYSVAQMIERYKTGLLFLEPDMIMVYAIPRDFTRYPRVELKGWSMAFPTSQPAWALPVACSGARLWAHKHLGWSWLAPEPAVRPIDPQLSEQQRIDTNLKALIDFSDELPQSTRLVLVISPTLPHPDNRPLPTIVTETLSREGIPCWDLTAALAANPALYYDRVHFNAAGHARVAEALAEKIKAELPSEG